MARIPRPTSKLRQLLQPSGAALLLFALAAAAQAAHLRALPAGDVGAIAPTLPNAEVLRIASLSHATSVADLYWLKLVQYLGSPEEEARGWPELDAIADLVVTLDPLYGYAYQAAGGLLASVDRVEASNALLERGVAQVPDRWELPFLLGFNRWQAAGDLRAAGDYLLRAASLPGSPSYLGDLANRLYSSSGSIEDGIAIVEASLRGADDPLIRKRLATRRDQLFAERALQNAERAIASFRSLHGRPPTSLDEIEEPWSKEIPPEILESIRYDPITSKVSSSLLRTRLVVYRPVQVPQALAAP